jgi:lysozyme family protein
MTDSEIIDAIIEREGGYVDDPADSGGPTKFGITQATLTLWKGHPVTAEDIRQLSVNEAREIYRQKYVVEPGFGAIQDDRLRSLLIDTGVNHSPKRAIEMLQRALGLKDDGVLGPQTRGALKIESPGKLWVKLMGERIAAYGRLITDKPSQAKFAAGWMARMKGLLDDFVT